MSLHGASAGSFSRRSLVRFRQSPRILRSAWKLLVLKPSLVERYRPFRDAPALGLIWLAAAMRPLTGARPLGTCATSGSDPTLLPQALCCSVMSRRLDFGAIAITPQVVMWV
jgi:hypothetical protein